MEFEVIESDMRSSPFMCQEQSSRLPISRLWCDKSNEVEK